MLKNDRLAQKLLVTMVTDTAFKINGTRLKCPYCPEKMMTFEHVTKRCRHTFEEVIDAGIYSENKSLRFKNTDLLPLICTSAIWKLKK